MAQISRCFVFVALTGVDEILTAEAVDLVVAAAADHGVVAEVERTGLVGVVDVVVAVVAEHQVVAGLPLQRVAVTEAADEIRK